MQQRLIIITPLPNLQSLATQTTLLRLRGLHVPIFQPYSTAFSASYGLKSVPRWRSPNLF